MTGHAAEDWGIGPAQPQPRSDEVHLWRGWLSGTNVAALRSTLSTDAVARAGRDRRSLDRDRFVAARGLLRMVLARYVDRPPEELRFNVSPQGKPVLADLATDGPRFNVAHSANLLIVAVVQDREIGVDVEQVRAEGDVDGVAAMTFSDSERATIASLPGDERAAAFFTGWVRKEACAKVTGEGVSVAMAEIDVLRSDRSTPVVVTLPNAAGMNVAVHSLVPGPGYVGATAVEATHSPVSIFHRWTVEEHG